MYLIDSSEKRICWLSKNPISKDFNLKNFPGEDAPRLPYRGPPVATHILNFCICPRKGLTQLSESSDICLALTGKILQQS